MKFKSRKDLLFSTVILGSCTILIGACVVAFVKGNIKADEYWLIPILLLVAFVLLWLFFGTHYELTPQKFIYKSGPMKGTISLDRIKEITVGKTLWVGYRPATARKGLIVKYDSFNEIYITPKTNETFIKKLLELKNDIKITKSRQL